MEEANKQIEYIYSIFSGDFLQIQGGYNNEGYRNLKYIWI